MCTFLRVNTHVSYVHGAYPSLFYGWLNKLEYCRRLCWHHCHSNKQPVNSTSQRMCFFFISGRSNIPVCCSLLCACCFILFSFIFFVVVVLVNTVNICFGYHCVVLGAKMLGQFLAKYPELWRPDLICWINIMWSS